MQALAHAPRRVQLRIVLRGCVVLLRVAQKGKHNGRRAPMTACRSVSAHSVTALSRQRITLAVHVATMAVRNGALDEANALFNLFR